VLGLESYGKAILEKEKDKVVIRPMKGSVVDQVAGSLRGYVRNKQGGWGGLYKIPGEKI